ncbi:ABC transporter substrate-binding protein [Romboutsia sp. 1001285H_161024_C4]|uniref:ABC transporter substrate-binding protein n=1 Tax=Romboutsia sp. 1001285H_161024_C4 TaxID=2787109 RepID=UPI00189B9B68|nr:ABC transporter substrate-binding protein [Romboutsia sp. 1001285H_161024_C4]
MRKFISILSTGIIAMGVLSGCSSIDKEKSESIKDETSKKVVKVVSPDGLPTIAIAKLIKEKPEIKSNYEIEYTIEKTSETLSTTVMKEEPDIAIVPSNMASIVYNKTKNYQIAGTTGFGSSYIVSTEDINNYEDLKGKNIMNIGKGLTPDITAQYIISEKGLNTEGDVNFSYVNSPSELVPMIVSGKENTAIVPEPALSALMTKKENVKIFKGLNDEYKEIADSEYGYPQATIIVKNSFLEENKDFTNKFLDNVKEGIEWANDNPSELATYCGEIEVSTEKPIIVKSIERANLKFVPIEDSKDIYKNYYKKLFDSNPKSLGGNIPDEGIFMER